MLYEKVNFKSSEILSIKAKTIIDYPMHKHGNAFEVIFVLKGEIDLYLVNMHETLGAGDIQICNPNELHTLNAITDDNVVLFLYINTDDSGNTFHDLNSYIFTTRNLKKDSASLQKLRACIRNIAEHYYEEKYKKNDLDTLNKDMVNLLIDQFQYYYIPDDYKFQASDVFKKNEIQIDRIRRANSYIYENYNKQIKLEDLAEIEGITPQHLTSILRSGGGIGFRKLLNMSRVEKSSHLLLGGNKSLQSISFECGFSKYKYFKDSFEKFYGISPADFREKFKDVTIETKAPKYIVPERNLILRLLKEMGNNIREIDIDIKKVSNEKPYIKYNSAILDLKNYNHLTTFEFIKDAADETSLKNIYLDGSFIAMQKTAWGNFSRIIADLFDLHLNIIITMDANEKIKNFESIIRFIAECDDAKVKLIELNIINSDSQKEKARKFMKIASDNHVDAVLTNKESLSIKLPIEKPGFIPAYLLETINRNDNEFDNTISLIYDIQAGKKSKPEGFGLIDQSGLKLPTYYLYYLQRRMGIFLLQKAPGYFISSNESKSNIHFLFYNYVEEFDENIGDTLKHSIDYKVNIDGLDGLYVVKKYRLQGEDFNNRFNPGFDLSKLSKESMSVFNESLEPKKSVNFVKYCNNHAFSFSLAPFEVMLISYVKV